MRGALWIVCLVLTSCDDTVFPGGEGGPAIGDAEGWCAVRTVFAGSCASCHSASGALGGLDLETDPHGAVVGVNSVAYGAPLVTPGDPEASLLLAKLEGTQGADQGATMPPGSTLEADVILLVRNWIADGADDVCDETGTVIPPNEGYHPPEWPDPLVHGYAAKFGGDDCRACHGETLEGGDGPACSSCHGPGWETNCTFCHGDPARVGGTIDISASPPEGIDDDPDDPTLEAFPAHLKHLSSDLHGDWDCTECHAKPASALDPGHLFDDDTPGRADVTFADGLSVGGEYRAQGKTCSNLYCHGATVGSNGTISVGESAECGSCHPGPQNDPDDLSGQHGKHVGEERIECADCHSLTVNGDGQILSASKARHIDGAVTIDFLATDMNIDNLRCTGSCHGEVHNNRSWID